MIKIKGFYFIIILGLLPFLALGLPSSNSLESLVLWWFTFGIIIGIIEITMFFKQDYMSSKECRIHENNNWYNEVYLPLDFFKANTWADGWKEYCKQSGDRRYLETTRGDFVPWIEFLNALLAIGGGTFIIHNILRGLFPKWTALTILVVSGIQIYGTILYFTSYYSKCYPDVKSCDLSWWLHLVGMNVLWIIFPIIVSVYAIDKY